MEEGAGMLVAKDMASCPVGFTKRKEAGPSKSIIGDLQREEKGELSLLVSGTIAMGGKVIMYVGGKFCRAHALVLFQIRRYRLVQIGEFFMGEFQFVGRLSSRVNLRDILQGLVNGFWLGFLHAQVQHGVLDDVLFI